MDPFMARTMIETLCKGIDPLSGYALPASDCCTNSDIQDALQTVLAHCSIESTEQYIIRIKEEKRSESKKKQERIMKQYPNSGTKWTSKEEKRMMMLHNSGYNIYQIANILKRTPSAVSGRMRELQERPVYRSGK